MYLKSIEVQGFKSFANKIVFEFHNGITGIVGPNGSGKSNVGDAVRWVLGEQSAKQLRGGNMQDVIFSGTETRKPLGFASVAITLDNSDHKLDIEYEEVTVTRRLYRSGESEYLLNGTSCRLKDINELFYDTGIGKEGYSIIGQGQIDKILSGKPEERRELFDEAAGIVKFKRRKATALKKLDEEQQNLVRVTDILSELTRQLGPLERQSETARIYLKKKEELKILDVNMYLAESAHIREQLKETEEKYRISQGELQQTQAQFDQTKAEYERLEKELEELDTKIQEARTQAGENALKKQQLENSVELLKEQIRAAQQNHQHYEERMQAIRQDLERRQQEAQGHEQEQEALKENLGEAAVRKKEAEEKLAILHQSIEETSQIIEDGKSEIIEILNQRASTKGKMQRYDAMLEQIGIRKAALSQRVLKLKSDESQQQEIIQGHQEKYKEISVQMDGIQMEYRKVEREVTSLRSQMEEQNKKLEQGQTAYHREASRLESLRNIAERYEGYGNSIRRVMEQRDRQPGIHGVVADLIKVEKAYEVAVETALGGSIQNIVTDNEQTAKGMIEYLKKNRYGRATFLPLTNMRNSNFQSPAALKEQGVIGLAGTLVTAESTYRTLLSQLLGRTLVVDTIDHAIAIARKYRHTLRIVTLEGESLSPGGSMTGGAFRNNSNLLGRNREIEILEKQVADCRAQAQEIRSRMEDVKTANALLKDDYEELQVNLQQAYLHKNTLEMETSHIREQQEKQEAAYAGIHEEIAKIDADKKEWSIDQAQMEEQIQMSVDKEAEITGQNNVLSQQVENKNLEIESVSQDLNDVLLEIAQKQQQKNFLQQNIRRTEEEIHRLNQEKKQILEDSANSETAIEEREKQIRQLQEQSEAAVLQKQGLDEKLTVIRTQKETMLGEQKNFFAQREELSQTMSDLDKELFRLNQQKEKTEQAQDSLTTYMWEEYEITYHVAKGAERPEKLNVAELKKQITGIRDEIRKLGNVNVNSIEEYKSVSERYEFLSAQHADLEEAKASLEKIITELDEGMRKQFAEKFADIQREFDRTFKELFGGGKGSLELTGEEDTNDILECGIKIIAQPPGKKLQNMMQLSGGEKALTAIALLFAIQNLKPSPFCLLDEIEAALDDSNVDRFANYLHKLTKNTQFIVITHRRGTMTAADRLYGITMQEKGVSALVSVNLIEKELDA